MGRMQNPRSKRYLAIARRPGDAKAVEPVRIGRISIVLVNRAVYLWCEGNWHKEVVGRQHDLTRCTKT